MAVHKKCQVLVLADCVRVPSKAAQSTKSNLQFSIGHNFEKGFVIGSCNNCGKLVLGNGYKCKNTNCRKTSCKDCKENFPKNCGIDERKLFEALQKNQSSERTVEGEQFESEVLTGFVNEMRIHFGEPFIEEREKDVKMILRRKIFKSKMYRRVMEIPLKVDFDDFQFIALLGRGAFGKVYLAERVEDKKVFAIKTVSKADIITGDDIDVTMAERRILALGNKNNFLTGLHSAFQVRVR